jgi:hypothetical protein
VLHHGAEALPAMGLVGELVGLDLGERVERTDAAFSAQIVVSRRTPPPLLMTVRYFLVPTLSATRQASKPTTTKEAHQGQGKDGPEEKGGPRPATLETSGSARTWSRRRLAYKRGCVRKRKTYALYLIC